MKPRHIALFVMLGTSCAVIDGLQGSNGTTDGGVGNPSNWKWHGPVQIDGARPLQSDAPRFALGPHGSAWVTWYEWNDSAKTSTVWVTSRPGGGAWANPLAIPAIAGCPVASYPQIAIGSTGDPIVFFGADNGTASPTRSMRAVRFHPGIAPAASDIVRLDATTSSTPQMSQTRAVVADDNGQAVALWGDGRGVYASASAGGTTWSTAQQLDANTSFETSAVTVAAGASGTALFGWADGTNAVAQPASISGGTITAGAKKNLFTGTNAPGPIVAMRGTKGMAAWQDSGGLGARPFSGDWGPPVVIPESSLAFYPNAALAVNTAGQAVLIWRRTAGGSDSYSGVVSGSFFDGTQWSTPALVSLDGPKRKCWWLSVDINDQGVAVASWADYDAGGTFTRIWANTLKFGKGAPTWQTPLAIDEASPTAGLADQPQNVRDISVGLDPAGTVAYVVYMQHEAGGNPRTWANWLE